MDLLTCPHIHFCVLYYPMSLFLNSTVSKLLSIPKSLMDCYHGLSTCLKVISHLHELLGCCFLLRFQTGSKLLCLVHAMLCLFHQVSLL